MSAEEIRQQIEKEARRRLEEHMDELRLEFERMRLESHRKWEEFLMRLDFPLPELVPQGSVPEAPSAAPAAADLSETRELARAIDAAGNQVDALKAFLTACRRSCDRAVLLVSRGDALAVWKAEGFSPAEETALRNVTLAPSGHAELSAAMDGTPVTVGPSAPISALFASGARRALVCPIVVREKISAVLYADQRDEGSAFDPEGLALLSYLIGVAVDRLATRKLRPAPALTPIRSLEPAPAPAARSFPAPAAYPVPAPAARPVLAPEPPPAMEIEEAAEAEPEDAPEPEPAPEPPAAPPSRGIDFDSTGHPYRPPAGVVPGGPRILRGPLAPVEEDPHEHARKIARLLVSDIRLYNEAAIEEGKRHNDIAARMRDDIDRARQTYNERVADSVRSTTDYFHEELVRSLADGNPDALGS
jgi:cell division septation protein DedD